MNAVTPIESTLAALGVHIAEDVKVFDYIEKREPLPIVVLFYSDILRTRRESLSNGDPIHRAETVYMFFMVSLS